MSDPSKSPRHNLIIGLLAILLIALSTWLNLYDRLEGWIGYEATWELDSFLLAGFILAAALSAMLLLQARVARRETRNREKLEIERNEREDRLRKLLVTTRAVPWEADARTWRFTYVGPQAQEVLGHPIERWTEPGFWSAHIHPEDQHRALEYCRDQSARSLDYEFEYRWLTDDGRTLWVYDIVHVVRREGAPARLRGFMIDISDRRRAAQALEEAHRELEHRVEARTVDLRRTNDALEQKIEDLHHAQRMLRQHQDRLRALATEVALAEERERRRIAAALHDRTIQSLGMSRIKLGALLKSRGSAEREELEGELRELIEGAIHDTRSLIFELSPPILYELGFEAAVEWLVERLAERTGITGTLTDDHTDKPLTNDLQIALFQAVRELLDNIERHARAKRFEVQIARDGERIRVRIEDDGVGFDLAIYRASPPTVAGYGLLSIRERLSLLEGTVEVKTTPGSGTRVELEAPLAGTARPREARNQEFPDIRP